MKKQTRISSAGLLAPKERFVAAVPQCGQTLCPGGRSELQCEHRMVDVPTIAGMNPGAQELITFCHRIGTCTVSRRRVRSAEFLFPLKLSQVVSKNLSQEGVAGLHALAALRTGASAQAVHL